MHDTDLMTQTNVKQSAQDGSDGVASDCHPVIIELAYLIS